MKSFNRTPLKWRQKRQGRESEQQSRVECPCRLADRSIQSGLCKSILLSQHDFLKVQSLVDLLKTGGESMLYTNYVVSFSEPTRLLARSSNGFSRTHNIIETLGSLSAS